MTPHWGRERAGRCSALRCIGVLALGAGCSARVPVGAADSGTRKPAGIEPGGFHPVPAEESPDRDFFRGPLPEPGFLSLEESYALARARDDTIFTKSARTVDFSGSAIVPRVSYMEASRVYDGSRRVGDPMDRRLRVFASTVEAVYGPHEDFTLGASIPFMVKEMTMRRAGRRLRLRSEGIGDLTLLGKWRFYKRPEPAETTEFAALFGVKLPTGRSDVRDAGMRLPRPLQPGSGSVDGIVGMAFTRAWDAERWLLNADVLYKANGSADSYRFGNLLRFDVGGQYRLYPARYERYDQPTVNAVLEANAEYAARDHQDGRRLSNTGGLKLFLSPGLQVIVTPRLLFEVGVQVPVYRRLNGPQLAEDFRFTIGLRGLF